MTKEKPQTIATATLSGDTFEAVQNGDITQIYGPDDDLVITYFANAGNTINDMTLRLIISAYFKGRSIGEVLGADRARVEIRHALGL